MDKQLQVLTNPLPVSAASLDTYIHAAYQLPVLSKEEEYGLAVDLRDSHNIEAAQKLIMHNLRFVVKIARGYLGYGLPLADLIQEGNIGLMKSVKRFDPEMEVRLVSFAVHWIRAEIHEFILRNWRIVKVATTKAQRKLFFNLRSSKKRLGWLNREEVDAVAGDLGVKPEEVVEMESRLSGQDVGFDLSSNEDDEHAVSPVAYLTHDGADPAEKLEEENWTSFNHQRLASALEELDERSIDILKQRWLNDSKATLHELADQYGVSAERIRQLEKSAMKKVRSAMQEAA